MDDQSKPPTPKLTYAWRYQTERFELIDAFHSALVNARENEGDLDEKGCDLVNHAFAVAKRLGWDSEADEDFLALVHKEVIEVILVEALRVVLGKLHDARQSLQSNG